ncbi:MAG: hypothetical protein ABL966_02065, partial [Acidimicrobiales bacterium]
AVSPRTLSYQASSTIYVGARQFSTDDFAAGLSGDRTVGLERIARTFAVMITSRPVAADAIELTGLPLDAGVVVASTQATLVESTNLIRITVTTGDPTVSQRLADGLADAFVDRVQDFEPGVAAEEGTVPSLPAYVYERAQFPIAPLPTSSLRRVIASGLFGLFASIGLVILLDYLDVTLRTPEQVEKRLGLPVLGSVPLQRSITPLPVKRRPRGA